MSVSGTGELFGALSDVSSATRTPGSVHGSTQEIVVTDVLLSGFGSFLVPLTVAMFVSVAGVAGAREVMVTVALAARASVPSLQVTVLVPEHLPWLVVADRKVAWAGSLSTSSAPLVEDGPLLAM